MEECCLGVASNSLMRASRRTYKELFSVSLKICLRPIGECSADKRLPNPVTREGGGILAYCRELLPLQHPRSFPTVGFGLKLFMPTSGLFPTFINRVMPGLTGSVVPCQAGLISARVPRSLFWRAIVPCLTYLTYLRRRIISHPLLTSE